MGGKGSGRPKIYKTEEERRQAILESKRKYNKTHREERIAYMKQWREKKELQEQVEKMKQVLEFAYKSLCRYEVNINGISVTITAESEKVSFYNWLKDVEHLIGKE